MKTNLKSWAGTLFLVLAACQSQDVQNENASDETLAIQIEAAIEGNYVKRAETVAGKSAFTQGNSIGMFAPGVEEAVEWTLADAGKWEPAVTLFWPNKTTPYTFYAFYPYAEAATTSSVPMPDLEMQDGTFNEEFDFLVATNTCTYADTENGMVSFSGEENQFKHVYSMLHLNFKNSVENDLSLGTVKVQLPGLLTTHVYDFTLGKPVVAPDGAAIDAITFAVGQNITAGQSHHVVFLANPTTDNQKLAVSISYEREGKQYTASAKASVQSLEASKQYSLNLDIQKNALSITGLEISEWSTGEIIDNLVMEEETEEETSN